MRAIADLAGETATPLEPPPPLLGEPAADDSPFRFAACGEVNCGKSSFLNGLLGVSNLCPVSDLPQRQPIRHYRFGVAHEDESQDPQLEVCRRHLSLLRDFELIDTPGIQSEQDAHLPRLMDQLQHADLIFCVLPVTNPWSAPTWNFLAGLAPHLHDRVVIVVGQADQREPADLDVMRDHLADLSSKKLDFRPPLFAISARRELEDGSGGYQPLRQHINRHLEQLESRRARVAGWLSDADHALAQIEQRIEEQARRLRQQDQFLSDINEEIREMRESLIQRLPHHLIEVAETFEKEAHWVSRLLWHRLGSLRSMIRLISGDRTAIAMEKLFIERIQSAVEQVAERDSSEVVKSCLEHWQELEVRVLEGMGIRLTSETTIESRLEGSRQRFIGQLRHAAEMGINNLKVRHQLEKEIRQRNAALKSFVMAGLTLTLAGAVCGILELQLTPWILIGGGALFFCAGVLASWATRRHILRYFREHLQDTCGAFAHTMEGDFEAALQVVFRDYADALSQVHERFAREKLAIEPRQKAWQQCFLSLKTIEQELA